VRLGIIGTYSFIRDTLRKNIFLRNNLINLYITDKQKENFHQNYFKNLGMYNINIYNDLQQFIGEAKILMIDASEKRVLFATIINNWVKYHQHGALILSNNTTVGLVDRISKKLKQSNQRIELINYIFVEQQEKCIADKRNRLIILGGNIYGKYISKIRKYIASKHIPVLLIPSRDAEAISKTIGGYNILKKAYLSQLEDYYEQNGLDIEIMKKAISFNHNLTISNERYGIDLKGIQLVSHAKQIVKGDNNWVIKIISNLTKYLQTPVKRIAIWGRISSSELDKLVKLPITDINFFSFSNIELNDPKLKKFNKIYASVENVDLLVINSYHDKFASISLNKLEKNMNRKIIIDRYNLFELEEMTALKWTYISKGRKKVYNF